MLTLSTLNCAIPKIINYCEFYNTLDCLYTLILCLLLSCNSWSVCTISKLCCRLIYNALLSRAFFSCDSQHFNTTFNSISTQHCTSQYIGAFFKDMESRKHKVRLYNLHCIHYIFDNITASPDSKIRKTTP